MCEPQFKIYGHERRAKKRELSLLRRSLCDYWHHYQVNEDMYGFYGHENPLSRSAAQEHYDSVCGEIDALEAELSVPYGEKEA